MSLQMLVRVGGSSSAVNAAGDYGTLGTAASTNEPPARAGAGSWIDSTGSLWLFGGSAFGGFLNDLWKFTPGTNQWTWVSGSSSSGAAGVYGTVGVGASGNVPGARDGAAAWIDGAGNFWLIGGGGDTDPLAGGELNDLWQYRR